MRRHERIMPDGCLLVVGYDPPLETFYGQVYKAGLDEEDEDPIRVWVGAAPNDKITTVAELANRLDPPEGPATGYGPRVLDLQAALELDQRTAPPPSPLQRRVRALFGDE